MNRNSNASIDTARELAALSGARVDGETAPSRVVVVPWGEVDSSAGSFVVDEEAGRMVVEAFTAHGTDLPIDYEHQTLGGAYASPDGTAPAAGWITQLEAVAGEGIVASVKWTDEAAEVLARRAYRYLSPVAMIRRADRKLVALHSAALTNKPAIVGMSAIVNHGQVQHDTAPVTGDGEHEGELVLLCRHLSLHDDASAEQVLVAARQRIEALELDARRRDAESRVALAQAAGKLTDAQRDWALDLALGNRELFERWEASAPTVVPLGRTRPPAGHGGASPSAASATQAARREYRASPLLRSVTSEEAYVAMAVRARR